MLDFKEELQRMSEQSLDSAFIDCEKSSKNSFAVLNDTVTKLFKKQASVEMQIEEMYSLLEEQEDTSGAEALENENSRLLHALIAAADLVEDFYLYYKEHYDETMTAQSVLMWNTLCKAMAVSGLTRIADENTPFHMHLNSIEGVANEQSVPDGFIVKVLKSGYLYQGKTYRKAAVIVNRTEDKHNE